jgi:hypothetical protein
LAQSGHPDALNQFPLLGVKRTSRKRSALSAFDPKRTFNPTAVTAMFGNPTTALYERFSSRGEAMFADRLVSAMRYEFGGHAAQADRIGLGSIGGKHGCCCQSAIVRQDPHFAAGAEP